MAQILGILTNDPSLLRCQLHRLRDSVPFGENEALGVGSFDDSNVLLAKRPAGAGPRDLCLLVDGLQGSAVLAVGQEVAAYVEEAIPPFRTRRWLFATSGAVEGYEAAREGMEAALPPFLLRSLRTTTDRERFFGLFLKELYELNQLDDPHLDGQEVARSLGRAIRALDEHSQRAGANRPSSLAAVATNGRVFAGARRGMPLSYLLTEGSGVCELCGLDESTPEDDPRVRPHRRARAVVLATRPAEGAGFVEIPDGSLIKVGRSLEINISSL